MPRLSLLELTIIIILLIPTFRALLGAPWVPTPKRAALKMLKSAKIKPREILYDLGCGDGRIVHLAATKYKAQATGLELSPIIFLMAKLKQLLLFSPARILFRNFKNFSLANADIITCYLMPETNARLQKKLEQELKIGTRVISYAFQFKNWQEAKHIFPSKKDKTASIWVYQIGKHQRS